MFSLPKSLILFGIILPFIACNNDDNPGDNIEPKENNPVVDSLAARVLSITFSGEESNYSFNVEIESPDTGCDQYADWWEVFTPDSTLIYRRILAHSHVNEQPFKRSGGPVEISNNQEVIIRAHMNNLGYGAEIFRGSISNGFQKDTLSTQYAIGLEMTEPLPDNCAF